jgi:hypothetical protein
MVKHSIRPFARHSTSCGFGLREVTIQKGVYFRQCEYLVSSHGETMNYERRVSHCQASFSIASRLPRRISPGVI